MRRSYHLARIPRCHPGVALYDLPSGLMLFCLAFGSRGIEGLSASMPWRTAAMRMCRGLVLLSSPSWACASSGDGPSVPVSDASYV